MKTDQLTRAGRIEIRKECEEIIYWGRLLVKAAGNPIEITYEINKYKAESEDKE